MKVFYRMSSNSFPKKKIAWATKEYCLRNFLTQFPTENIVLIADNLDSGLYQFVRQFGFYRTEKTSFGNAKSFRYVLQEAITFPDSELVYFVEDDYLHRDGSKLALEEAMQVSSYATLYDHPDKYVNFTDGGPNPFIADGGEVTRLILTKSSHWKMTNSTTMTFATTVRTLKEDYDIFNVHTQEDCPTDFNLFCDLRHAGRRLVSSVPGLSTHVEIDNLSPIIRWEKV
jgi:hypothetical protein